MRGLQVSDQTFVRNAEQIWGVQKMDAIELRNVSHCPLSMCKAALKYAMEHNGDDYMAIAYLKAKTLAVKTSCSFDDRVQLFMRGSKNG